MCCVGHEMLAHPLPQPGHETCEDQVLSFPSLPRKLQLLLNSPAPQQQADRIDDDAC